MKILKSKKALSPVVASIILIAVTVAVSIAVAAWMGALTIGFMGTSSVSITKVEFNGVSDVSTNNITLTVKNTGTNQITIGTVKVNNVVKPDFIGDPSETLASGDIATITIEDLGWVNGNQYKIDLYDASGTAIGSTQETAPS